MKASSFFYISAGCLCLAVAYSTWVGSARADFTVTPGPIRGFNDDGVVLRSDATEWQIRRQDELGTAMWVQQYAECNNLPPGVTMDDVAFWNGPYVVTTADVGWVLRDCNSWLCAGPIPTPAVGAQRHSWSAAKSLFRR